MKVTGVCQICHLEKEDAAHALFKCPHAHHLWNAMRDCWQLPAESDLHAPPRLWFRSVLLNVRPQMINNTLLVAWRVWYARNEITHNKPLPSVEGSKCFLCSYTKILSNIQNTSTDQVLKGKQLLVVPGIVAGSTRKKNEPPDKPWSKPPLGWVKLSIDGSFRVEDGTAGAGMILRDANGGIIFSACRSLQLCAEVLEAELRSCLEGLELALQHSQLPIIIDTDCSQLVAIVSDKVQDRSSFLHIISEIKSLADRDRV